MQTHLFHSQIAVTCNVIRITGITFLRVHCHYAKEENGKKPDCMEIDLHFDTFMLFIRHKSLKNNWDYQSLFYLCRT